MQFPATEQHSIAPECPYGVSKRSAELYIQYFSRIHSIPSICLRYGNVYGPRQNPKGEAGVVAIFINNLLASRPLRVNGDGLQTRDFVYVDDVAGANIAAAKTKSDNIFEIFNIGLGKESTVLDIVESLKKHWSQIKHDDVVSVEFGPALKGEQRRSVIDPSKASKGLNWRPEVELDKGLSNTVKSFLKK
jgi:UDP-glucose 4-epimerase